MPIPLTPQQVLALLKGIEDHGRAGNFDQVRIQSRDLLARLETESPGEYRAALPKLRELLGDADRHNTQAVIRSVQEAQLALGFRPE